jgi:hypothetical protein
MGSVPDDPSREVPMQTPTLFVSLALAGSLSAQFGGLGAGPMPLSPPPLPPQLLPTVPPAVDHPAYAAQPLIESGCRGAPPAAAPSSAPKPPPETPEAKAAREFKERRVAGKELKKSIEAARKKLEFRKDPADARAMAAASHQPLLWVQALGDLDGLT